MLTKTNAPKYVCLNRSSKEMKTSRQKVKQQISSKDMNYSSLSMNKRICLICEKKTCYVRKFKRIQRSGGLSFHFPKIQSTLIIAILTRYLLLSKIIVFSEGLVIYETNESSFSRHMLQNKTKFAHKSYLRPNIIDPRLLFNSSNATSIYESYNSYANSNSTFRKSDDIQMEGYNERDMNNIIIVKRDSEKNNQTVDQETDNDSHDLNEYNDQSLAIEVGINTTNYVWENSDELQNQERSKVDIQMEGYIERDMNNTIIVKRASEKKNHTVEQEANNDSHDLNGYNNQSLAKDYTVEQETDDNFYDFNEYNNQSLAPEVGTNTTDHAWENNDELQNQERSQVDDKNINSLASIISKFNNDDFVENLYLHLLLASYFISLIYVVGVILITLAGKSRKKNRSGQQKQRRLYHNTFHIAIPSLVAGFLLAAVSFLILPEVFFYISNRDKLVNTRQLEYSPHNEEKLSQEITFKFGISFFGGILFPIILNGIFPISVRNIEPSTGEEYKKPIAKKPKSDLIDYLAHDKLNEVMPLKMKKQNMASPNLLCQKCPSTNVEVATTLTSCGSFDCPCCLQARKLERKLYHMQSKDKLNRYDKLKISIGSSIDEEEEDFQYILAEPAIGHTASDFTCPLAVLQGSGSDLKPIKEELSVGDSYVENDDAETHLYFADNFVFCECCNDNSMDSMKEMPPIFAEEFIKINKNINTNGYPRRSRRSNHRLLFSILIGDGIQKLVNGALLGVALSLCQTNIVIPMMMATFYHELANALGIFFVLRKRVVLSVREIFFYHFLSSIILIIGSFVSLVISLTRDMVGIVLCASAGVYVYTSGVECIPKVQKSVRNKKEKILSILWFVIGVTCIMCLIVYNNDYNCGWKHIF